MGVSGWVHPGAQSPNYIGPVAGINVVVYDNDQFRVQELSQIRPYPEHDTPGMTGIFLTNADDSDSIRACFAGEVEVDDFGKLCPQNGDKDVVQGQTGPPL